MGENGAQARFFQMIREQLDARISMADELADVLQVSTDSAYRRLRGETALTFQEIATLSRRYGVSADAAIALDADEVIFRFKPLKQGYFEFLPYLQYIEGHMAEIAAQCPNAHLLYIANDIPLFQLLHVPEVASFKLFFWQKTILDFDAFRAINFRLGERNQMIDEVSMEIRKHYCKIPSTEIYHSGSIATTLKQIEYYAVSGMFEEPAEAAALCSKLSELVEHLKDQCQLGKKFIRGNKPTAVDGLAKSASTYDVFHNEVIHTDNTILAQYGSRYMSVLTSNGLSALSTSSERYYREAHNSFEVLKSKSTLISRTSEKERNRVFLGFQNQIRETLKRLDAMGLPVS